MLRVLQASSSSSSCTWTHRDQCPTLTAIIQHRAGLQLVLPVQRAAGTCEAGEGGRNAAPSCCCCHACDIGFATAGQMHAKMIVQHHLKIFFSNKVRIGRHDAGSKSQARLVSRQPASSRASPAWAKSLALCLLHFS